MPETFGRILLGYRDFIVVVASVFLALIWVARFWGRMNLWSLNLWYRFPLIGKLARIARVLRTPTSEDQWRQSERKLCNDYKKLLRIKEQRQFLECKTYLKKAGDSGRTPLPFAVWIMIVALVFIEAIGFSYVLDGWNTSGSSENAQIRLSYAVALVLSVALVAFTQLAGHELHRSSLMREALEERRRDNKGRGAIRSSSWDLEESLTDPLKPQSADDDQPLYTQLANRVGAQPTYRVTVLTLIAVITVAGFAAYTRNTVCGGAAAVQASTFAFALLAVVFVFLQILGVLFGVKWGFAGKESANAYALLGGRHFETFDDYRRRSIDPIIEAAQYNLETLREQIAAQNERDGWAPPRFSRTSFLEFLVEAQERELTPLAHPTSKRSYAAAALPAVARMRPYPPPGLPPVPPPIRRYYFTDLDSRPSASPVNRGELDRMFLAGVITTTTWTLQEGSCEWVLYGDLLQSSASSRL